MPPVVSKPLDAVEKAESEVTANPNSAEAHARLAWAYYGKGQYDEAARAVDRALSLDPDNFEAHYALGLIHKATGAKLQAVAEFEKASALAAAIEDAVRRQMLQRLIRGHINEINTGDWNLGKHIAHA
ncbi:MAG: tetratricopeptide repeat protein [Anaerolineales bacterium]|nr:tetratricopeptide repeat protein [Anaerolineales bacterium]